MSRVSETTRDYQYSRTFHLFTHWTTIAAIFFLLMLYKFITSESFRLELSNVRESPFAKWFELRHFSPLLYLLLRDGIIYFAMCVLLIV